MLKRVLYSFSRTLLHIIFIANDCFLIAVPPKAKGRKRDREIDKPLSGLNVEELLQTEKRVKISPDNAIPEFKQSLVNSQDLDAVKDAVKQMSSIIESQIRHSLGDANYDRAVEGLGTMKEELVAFEEPTLYNDFIRNLKTKLLGNDLGGDRREMWWYIRKNRLGLIDKRLSELSDVTEEEARAVSNRFPSHALHPLNPKAVSNIWSVFIRKISNR